MVKDLWGDSDSKAKIAKNNKKFQNFSERTSLKVKPVIVPLSGQSYNPSAKDH